LEANQEEQRFTQQAKDKASWTPEEEMAPLWTIEDNSQNLRMEAKRQKVQIEQLLHSALTHKRDLPEAHEKLVLFYIDSHKEAERNENRIKMSDAFSRIQFHTKELHESNLIRTNAELYVKGTGSVSLQTNETGADVFVAPFIEKNRRFVLGEERFLGKTPLQKVPIEMGSHQLRICKENRKEVLYPIQISRQHHWSGINPLGTQQPIHLPLKDELGTEDCYVPAGYFLCGKDPNIQVQLPSAEVWVDGFVVRKYPVTNREILAQLNDLSLRGYSEQLEEAIPRPRSASGEYGYTCFEKQPDGSFALIEDENGIVPDLDFPVVMISWHQAVAYTKWISERTGQKWRLLDELEWEKSSKGVDGRFFPWGNHFHPNWCCMDASKTEKSIERIFDRPSDVSVYGVEGLAGNVFDWTRTPFHPLQGLPEDNYCRPKSPKISHGQAMTFRGGSWHSFQMFSHLSFRWGWEDFQTWPMHGFRIGRSLS
jgi:serine/threonine-protein kinase